METKNRGWNPRYTLYAKAHGHSEIKQLDVDTEKHPACKMIGFTKWIQAKWRQFEEDTGSDKWTKARHYKFNKWLGKNYQKPVKET